MNVRLSQLLKLLESSPNEPFVLFALAKEHESLGDEQQALAFYLRLMATDPNYVGLYYHLGKLYESLDELEKATETYREGIERCKMAGDRHAQSELQGALLNVEYN
jgi:hypothetical protein